MTKMLKLFTFCVATVSLLLPSLPGQEGNSQQVSEGNPKPAQNATAPKQSDRKVKDEVVEEKIVPEKEAVKQLVGGYRIVSGESSGKQILPERLADVTVRITEKTITTYDGDRQQRFSANYRLDTQQRPWRIKMVSKANPGSAPADSNAATAASPATTTSEGLIKITEQGAKVIYALPSGETPRSFKTAALQQLFVLERLIDPAEKAGNPNPATSEGSKSDK